MYPNKKDSRHFEQAYRYVIPLSNVILRSNARSECKVRLPSNVFLYSFFDRDNQDGKNRAPRMDEMWRLYFRMIRAYRKIARYNF